MHRSNKSNWKEERLLLFQEHWLEKRKKNILTNNRLLTIIKNKLKVSTKKLKLKPINYTEETTYLI